MVDSATYQWTVSHLTRSQEDEEGSEDSEEEDDKLTKQLFNYEVA